MIMTSKIVKIGLGLGLLWYGVLRGAKGLVIGIKNFTFHSVDLANKIVSLTINLSIKNPLFVGLTIKGVKGDVYAQGVKVGYVNTTYDYYLSGAHTHILPIVVNLQMDGVTDAAWLNIQSGDINSLTLAFDGKVYVGNWNIGIPLQLDLTYNDLVK